MDIVRNVTTAISMTITSVESAITSDVSAERRRDLCGSLNAALTNLNRIVDKVPAGEYEALQKHLGEMIVMVGTVTQSNEASGSTTNAGNRVRDGRS